MASYLCQYRQGTYCPSKQPTSRHLKVDVVVFDGYATSTKDVTHTSRSTKTSQVFKIHGGNSYPSDRTEFLSNSVNKQSSIDCWSKKLNEIGISGVLCPSDADTSIVKTALDVIGEPVTILADDTDTLCLLFHHVYFHHGNNNVFLETMRIQKDADERVSFSINDVIHTCDTVYIEWILFAHAFCGCDTTSIIHKVDKTSMLN